MDTSIAKRANTLPVVANQHSKPSLFQRLCKLYERSDRFVSLLVGMRSYDKYVEHMRTKHPERPILSRREFFKEALEARYGGGVSRCC